MAVLLVVSGLQPAAVLAAEPSRGAETPAIKASAINAEADAGLVTDSSKTDLELVQMLVGDSVPIENVKYTGKAEARGAFSGGTGIIGFEKGIVLSSGDIQNVVGPNENDGISSGFGTPGDTDLSNLISGAETNDAAVLEFDFIPVNPVISFAYVFASDEYNEFVYSYNDVFGFFVNGQNVALVPGTDIPVSIDNVNGGNPYGSDNARNSGYFRNNDLSDKGGSINTEMDGLTTVLHVEKAVNPGVINHIKLAIADAKDTALDSVVFIKAGSFADKPVQYGDLSFKQESYSVNENIPAGYAEITVERKNGSDGDVTVDYSTSDLTAEAGKDYTAASGTFTFKDGETSKSFMVPIINDSELESSETVALKLENPTGGAKLGTYSEATLTIVDDEVPPEYGAFSFELEGYSVDENAASGYAQIKVLRKGGSDGQVTIDYSTSDLEALAGYDYELTSGTLSFAAGETSKSFTVSIYDDYQLEGDETLQLSLTNPAGGAVLGSPNSVILTIVDNEQPPRFYFSEQNYTVAETVYGAVYNNIALITVNFVGNYVPTIMAKGEEGGDYETEFSVAYNTSNGTAAADSDYVPVSGRLYFEPWDTEQSFEIEILSDSIYEGDETIKLSLSEPSGAILGEPHDAVLTIKDGQSPPPDNDDDDDKGGGGGGKSSGSSKPAVVVPVEKAPATENLPWGTIIDRMAGYISLGSPTKINEVKAEIELAYDTALLKNKPTHSPRAYYWNAEKGNWVAMATYPAGDGKVRAINEGKYKGWFAVFGVIQPQFSDMQGSWAEQVVNRMNGLGMIEGYPIKGEALLRTAKIEQKVSRAEFIMFVSRILNIDIDDPRLPLISTEEANSILAKRYTDSSSIPGWALRAAGTLEKAGIIHFEGAELDAAEPITRAEAAVMISKALKLLTQCKAADCSKYTDSGLIPDWVKAELADGVMTGYPGGDFKPQERLTRAESMTMLHRLFVEGLGW